MKVVDRLKRLFKRRRSTLETDPFREFVYLDEVSVMSLLASQLGAIPTEITNSRSSAFREESGSSASATLPGLKADLSEKSERTRTVGTQVVRKMSVQAAFRHLRKRCWDQLTIRQEAFTSSAQTYDSLAAIKRAHHQEKRDVQAIPVTQLRRGAMIEVRVVLRTDPLLEVGTVMSTLSEFLKSYPDLISDSDAHNEDLQNGMRMADMLQDLLGDVIPVRGFLSEYQLVEIDGEEWLVHKDLLASLPDVNAVDVELAGFADVQNFWKDIRRILFADAEYTVMARLGTSGLSSDWSPVKMRDLLARIVPDFATAFESIGEYVFTAHEISAAPVPPGSERPHEALVEFARALSAVTSAGDTSLDPVSVPMVGLPSNEWPSLESCRRDFAKVAELHKHPSRNPLSADQLAELRASALEKVGLLPDGRAMSTAVAHAAAVTPPTQQPKRLLTTELVAIYW